MSGDGQNRKQNDHPRENDWPGQGVAKCSRCERGVLLTWSLELGLKNIDSSTVSKIYPLRDAQRSGDTVFPYVIAKWRVCW